jgi:putative ABC transport system permease protein
MLGLAVVLIGNVSAAAMAGQVREIGILKTLGGRRVQIVGLYAQPLLIYSLTAIVFAIPAAHVMGRQLSQVLADRMNFLLPGFWLPPEIWTLQVVAGLALPLVGALVSIGYGSRITVLEALGEPPSAAMNAGRLGRVLTQVTGVSVLTRVAIRNVFRRLGRMLSTLGMLTLAGAMFVAVLGTRQSLQADLAKVQRTVDYDVALSTVSPLPQNTLLRRARSVAGIIEVEAWLQADAQIVLPDRRTGSVPVIGLPVGSSLTRPNILQGRWFLPEEVFVVFFSSNILELIPGLKPGDVVVLKIADRERRWTVVGLEDRQLRPTAMVPLQALERATRLTGMAHTVVVRTSERSPTFQRQVEGDLRFAFRDWTIAGTRTVGEERQSQAAQLDLLLWLLRVVLLLVLVDGGLGFAVTMGLNVMERTREMGVLRALGAQDRSIRILVLSEGLTLGLLSWILGVAGAIRFGVWLTTALGRILYGRPVEFIFSAPAVLLWLSVVLVIGMVGSLLPAQRALDIPVREALGYRG